MTAQVSERLIYGDKEISLFTNPLGVYLRASKVSFVSPHTANWRGYVGTWELKEHEGVERLYLVDLQAHKSYEELIGIKDIFPGFDTVFAHWFTGELRLPQGSLLNYVHGGYASTYEYDLLIEIKQGVVTGKHAKHNEPPPKKDEKEYPSFLRRGNA